MWPRAGRRVDTEYVRSRFEARSARDGSRVVRERSEAWVGLGNDSGGRGIGARLCVRVKAVEWIGRTLGRFRLDAQDDGCIGRTFTIRR